MSAEVVAGVDVGGTKTRVRLVTGARVRADVTVRSEGWQTRDLKAAGEWLAARLRAVVAGAGAAGTLPVRLAVGAHACETPAMCAELSTHLRALLGIPVTVVNDAELLVPAAGFAEGIGLVAGTGSIAVGRHAKTGAYLKAGGWGWVLGDEGSGSALVREAARAWLAALDEGAAGAAGDPLGTALLDAFAVGDGDALAAAMSWDGGVETWGAHAPAVFAAAEAGSALARDVIARGGADLAALVARLARRGAHHARVVAAGGVITAQPALWTAFTRALGDALPKTRAVLLDAPPVEGAVRLALTTA
ncbi:BadF/BadG/BcrA/BcrD ATPase family protein [Streptomyces sp. P6-2-1]|uniref:BadF/BadG/BcrA/BcrD ATPase family protein n=1 Tax=Streptomyces sp. P6-2-1 TaxID=3422591 RepID=UPI003D35DE5C